jgi:hypothetical protein
VKRRKSLDRALPTLFTLSLPLAAFSLRSDVWEIYWLIVISLFLFNLWYFWNVISRALSINVYWEMRSALPAKHERTELDPPGNGAEDGYDDIHTGSMQGENLMPIKWKIFGILTWVIWFGFGIKTWWFSDTRFIEYIVATILWILTFFFTALGIPFTQAILRNRKNI